MNSRYTKILTFTANKEDIRNMEATINKTVDKITECGGKVISHYSQPFGISPMYYIHSIIYERESSIPSEKFN